MNISEKTEQTRRFGKREAVHGLTLAVPEGSVLGLLGPNGAGKSSTIKTRMNPIEPPSGSARGLGVDSRRLGGKEKTQIGYVSENRQRPLGMTVRQFLDHGRPFYPTWDRALEKTLLAQFA
jgi:ABC-2 type transport system ATP-binding protein